MQQFLLFYTMLIVASEAFSQELHGSRIPRNIKRRTSRFANKLIPPNRERFKFRRLSFPLFSSPPLYDDSPDYEVPLVVPFEFHLSKRWKQISPRENRRFSSRKRSRRKHSRRRGWSPPREVAAPMDAGPWVDWPAPPPPDPRPVSHTTFIPEVLESRFMNPNQYIVYLYPVFIRPRKRRVDPFLNSQRQYVTSLRNKNKRSAVNGTKEVSSEGNVPEGHKNKNWDDRDVPKTSPEVPSLDVLAGKNPRERDYNVDAHLKPGNFKYDDFQQYRRDYLDLYNPYVGPTRSPIPLPQVTLPTVTFKYPYDPKVYESSMRRNEKSSAPKKEENCKKQVGQDSAQDFSKLRDMLRQVECMLENENPGDMKEVDYKCDEEDKKRNEKKEENKDNQLKLNDTISLKQKIDNIAIPILTQISERLGNMTNGTTTTSTSKYDNTPSKLANYCCSADGTWRSSAYGVEFNFRTLPNMMLKVQASNNSSAAINNKWSIQGLTLSKSGGPLMLAAIYPQKRKIASFIGQCKTCQNQDLIFGSWTVYTSVRRFTDLWNAMETRMDILKKVKSGAKSPSKKNQKKVKGRFKVKG